MRTLLATTSGAGHVLPLLGIAKACQSLGHDVLVVGPAGGAETLARSNLDHVLGEDPPADAADRVWAEFGSLPRDQASVVVEREWFMGLCATALLPAVEDAVASFRPDVIVREPCEYASAVVADRLGIPRLNIGISTAAAEMGVLTSLVRSDLDGKSPGLADRLITDPYLTRFPESLDPSPFPATVRYRDDAPLEHSKPIALDDAWGGSTAPLIYVTLGTVAMRQPIGREVLRFLVGELAALDVRVLATTAGATGLGDLGRGAANVHVAAWVPQQIALGASSLVVCHGGSGTTFGALAAGVPLVFVPLFADQPTNARLVESAGAGVALSSGDASAQANALLHEGHAGRLRAAVREVLADPAYRAAAGVIGDELAKLPTAQEAIVRALALRV